MIRLYYWIKGAPENRPGGPWWYQDLEDQESLQKYLQLLGAFLHRACTSDNPPMHGHMNIYPPKDAVGVHLSREKNEEVV